MKMKEEEQSMKETLKEWLTEIIAWWNKQPKIIKFIIIIIFAGILIVINLQIVKQFLS